MRIASLLSLALLGACADGEGKQSSYGRRPDWSMTLPDGMVVGALAVVNAAGQVISTATGLPQYHEGIALRRPAASERRALIAANQAPPTPDKVRNRFSESSESSSNFPSFTFSQGECKRLSNRTHAFSK
jgi:hypothetical protein